MPTPQRVQHNTPAMRKNPSLSRNGGSDAEIMELNQQVELNCIVFLPPCFVSCLLEEQRFPKSMVEFRAGLFVGKCQWKAVFFSPPSADGVEADCGRTREGKRLLLQQTTGYWVDLPGTRERKQPHPQQDNQHSLRNRGTLYDASNKSRLQCTTAHCSFKSHWRSWWRLHHM